MPQLDNPRHERFAQLAAAGDHTDIEAYQIAYGSSWDTAHTNAWTIRADKGVQARIAEIQRPKADKTIADREEILRYLTRGLRSAVGNLDESSDLVQSYKHTPEIRELKMIDKLKATELLAKMQGMLESGSTSVSVNVVSNLIHYNKTT